MINIPIYRAKKIDSDEYVEGYLYPDLISSDGGQRFALKDDYGNKHSVVLVTLAIHFPDMLDSEGNKIFASLSEYGKGGDILYIHVFTMELAENLGVTEGEEEFEGIAIFNGYGIGIKRGDKTELLFCYSGLHEESIKIIGIKQ